MQVKNLNNGQEFLFVPCHFFFNRYNPPSVLILGGAFGFCSRLQESENILFLLF